MTAGNLVKMRKEKKYKRENNALGRLQDGGSLL